MRRETAWLVCAVALVGACGSKKEKPAEESNSSASTGSAQAAAGDAPATASGQLVWNEAPRLANPKQKIPHEFHAPPPQPIADPDAVIARHTSECRQGATSDTCKDLKRKVELILLETILVLRKAHEPIDRKWWRVAAAADLPQLACQGVFALSRLQDRTAEDDAVILAAFEHPAPSVRSIAVATRLPAFEPLFARVTWSNEASGAGTCIDGRTDRTYDLRWAGGYPNARYRFFASSQTRRWFTTPDSVEKVTEFFTKAGRPPRTEDQLQAEMQQEMTAEILRITQTDGDAEKMAAEVNAIASRAPPKLENVDGAGEIRYVMLTSNIGIAIFKDDVLKATSIVALAPPPTVDMSIEGLQRQQVVRQVYEF